MKLLKKAGAVLLALAMIAVMLPQLGNKVVKAAGTSHILTGDTTLENMDTFFTYKPGGATKLKPETVSSTTDACLGFSKGLKGNSSFGFNFTVGENEYATIVVYANKRKPTAAAADIEIHDSAYVDNTNKGNLLDSYKEEIAADKNTPPDVFTSIKVYTNGTFHIGTSAEMAIYKVQVDVYSVQSEAQAIVDAEIERRNSQKKVDLSGTITSSIDLTGGTVTFKGTDGALKESEAIESAGGNTYTYIVKEVKANAEYILDAVKSDKLAEAAKLVRKIDLNAIKFDIATDAYTNGNFEVPYYDLPENVWNFNDMSDWTTFSIEKKEDASAPTTGIYKSLIIDVTNGGKFATGTDSIQVNEKTRIRIPVAGYGEVTCTFSSSVETKLNGNASVKATTNTAKFTSDDNYVELEMIGASNLKKIEIKPSAIQNPVIQMGASVRQETAEWGNGIRFGGQLDLTKVDKATCTSGTLIGLAATVGDGNKMTLENVGTTCIDVVRTTFIEETDATLDYAAALINIPEANLDTSIVARPYVTVNGITYYGDQIATTYNNATKIVNEQ